MHIIKKLFYPIDDDLFLIESDFIRILPSPRNRCQNKLIAHTSCSWEFHAYQQIGIVGDPNLERV